MRTKRDKIDYPAYIQNLEQLLPQESGTWKIETIYCSKKSGEIFKTGKICFQPNIYAELVNAAHEIERDGGEIMQQNVIKIDKITKS